MISKFGLLLVGLISSAYGNENHLSFRPVERPILDLGDLKSAEVRENGAAAKLSLQLTQEGAEKLQAFSSGREGEMLALVLDGEVVSVQRLNSPITGQEVELGPYPIEKAKKVADIIN